MKNPEDLILSNYHFLNRGTPIKFKIAHYYHYNILILFKSYGTQSLLSHVFISYLSLITYRSLYLVFEELKYYLIIIRDNCRSYKAGRVFKHFDRSCHCSRAGLARKKRVAAGRVRHCRWSRSSRKRRSCNGIKVRASATIKAKRSSRGLKRCPRFASPRLRLISTRLGSPS